MNTLANFESFKLSKTQMNDISGGVRCLVMTNDMWIKVNNVAPGISAAQAEQILQSTYSWADSVECYG